MAAAKSSIHEIQAYVGFLISAVTISGATIVEAIVEVRNELKAIRENPPGASETTRGSTFVGNG